MPCYDNNGNQVPAASAQVCTQMGGRWGQANPYVDAFKQTEAEKVGQSVRSSQESIKDIPILGGVYDFLSPVDDIGSVVTTIVDPELRAEAFKWIYDNPKSTVAIAVGGWLASKNKKLQKLGAALKTKLGNRYGGTDRGVTPEGIKYTTKPSFANGVNTKKVLHDAGGAYYGEKLLGGREGSPGVFGELGGVQQQQQQTQGGLPNVSISGSVAQGGGTPVDGSNLSKPSIFDKMGDKAYWQESMSGIPGDTRASRIGQLMSYYGQRKGQRTGTNPAEIFAGLDAEAVRAASSGQSTFKTSATAPTEAALKDAYRKEVETRMAAGNFFFDADEKEVERALSGVISSAKIFAKENNLPLEETIQDFIENTDWEKYKD